jgi:uncharacterized protein YndB with AHSA1/START domain
MPDDETRDDPEPASRVTRSVDVEAGADEVWSALTDPDLRGRWLDDEDATSRTVRFDEVDSGRRLVWTWWRPGDEPGASTVEVVLAPTTVGTRVIVTETLPAVTAAPSGRTGFGASGATASALAATGGVPHGTALGRAWSLRLLGLELLFVVAGVCVR